LVDNFKKFSALGLRGAFGPVFQKFIEQESEQNKWRFVCADTSTSMGLGRLRSASPQNFVEVGIAEQAAVAIATGLALEKVPTYVGSFAPFIVGRCWEQIRLASYMGANLVIVGFGGGLGLSYLGYTHCALEDVGLMNEIPNTHIFEPSTPDDIYRALQLSASLGGIKYLRLTGEGVINRSLYGESFKPIYDGFGHIREASGRRAKKLVITSGYMASRIATDDSSDMLVWMYLSKSPDSQFLQSYDEIVIIAEAYSSILYQKIQQSLMGCATKLTVSTLAKKFSKPGGFDFCAEELGWINHK
jgi:transketolase